MLKKSVSVLLLVCVVGLLPVYSQSLDLSEEKKQEITLQVQAMTDENKIKKILISSLILNQEAVLLQNAQQNMLNELNDLSNELIQRVNSSNEIIDKLEQENDRLQSKSKTKGIFGMILGGLITGIIVYNVNK